MHVFILWIFLGAAGHSTPVFLGEFAGKNACEAAAIAATAMAGGGRTLCIDQ
jgi:hypothetical protein